MFQKRPRTDVSALSSGAERKTREWISYLHCPFEKGQVSSNPELLDCSTPLDVGAGLSGMGIHEVVPAAVIKSADQLGI